MRTSTSDISLACMHCIPAHSIQCSQRKRCIIFVEWSAIWCDILLSLQCNFNNIFSIIFCIQNQPAHKRAPFFNAIHSKNNKRKKEQKIHTHTHTVWMLPFKLNDSLFYTIFIAHLGYLMILHLLFTFYKYLCIASEGSAALTNVLILLWCFLS